MADQRRPWTLHSVRTSRMIPVWVFSTVLAVIAGSCWWMAVRSLPLVPAPFRVPWPVLAAGFAVGYLAGVRVHFGKEGHRANLADAVLIPSLVFAGPDRVVLAATLGTLAYSLWVRRSVVKAAFNICSHALATTVAVVCFHLVAGRASGLSVRGLLAAVVAVLVVSVITDGAIQVVIALSTGSFAGGLRDLTAFLGVMVGLNSTVGAAAVLMMSANVVVGGTLCLAVGIGGGLCYSAYGRLRVRHANLEHLYRFNQALAGVIETDDVIRAVLGEARAVLNARIAQLVVVGTTGVVCHTLSEVDAQPVSTNLDRHPFVDAVAPAPGGILAIQDGADPAVADALAACGFRDAVAVRLHGDEGATGILIVADRLGEHLSFGRADLALVTALASHTAVALRSSQLHAVKEHQASHDALTGLANRTLFASTLDDAIDRRPRNSLVGIMLMDLDGFKEVNDTFGHDVGDLLLQQLALRLRSVVGPRGVIARLGGDEFAVAVPSADTVAEVMALADQLSIAVQAPIWVADTSLEMRASIGVTLAPLHGEDRSTLMRRADRTMYRAKRRGGGVAVHDDRQDDVSVHHPSLLSELREAIRAAAMTISYQPVADIRTGAVTGAEALLRWTHPLYGPISPDQFIPLAERSGLIRPLTQWVLDTSLEQLAAWQRQGEPTLNLSVNLSPSLLGDVDIVAQVRRLLQRHQVAPGSLTLELTESSVGGDRSDDHHVLDQLAGIGVRLSIDDFGTGYSSLSRLHHLPFSELKIDKSFIDDILTSTAACSIVESTIDLARNLGVTVVAEGVETDETWLRLRQLRCHSVQGYLLSPALTAPDFIRWMQEQPAQHVHGDNVIELRSLPNRA